MTGVTRKSDPVVVSGMWSYCPRCGSEPGTFCYTEGGTRISPSKMHKDRRRVGEARVAAKEAENG